MTKLILAIIAAVLLTACSSSPCPDRDMAPFLAEARLLHAEFSDAYDLAYSSPRINLPPLIQGMQDIRNQVRRLDVPQCGERTMTNMDFGMELAIDSLTGFVESESMANLAVVDRNISLAVLDQVLLDLDKLEENPIWGLTPTPTPTNTPTDTPTPTPQPTPTPTTTPTPTNTPVIILAPTATATPRPYLVDARIYKRQATSPDFLCYIEGSQPVTVLGTATEKNIEWAWVEIGDCKGWTPAHRIEYK